LKCSPYSFTTRCRCRSLKIRKWSRHSRRTLPRKRSQTAFAFGAAYSVHSTSIPVPTAILLNLSPYLLSLSRSSGHDPQGTTKDENTCKGVALPHGVRYGTLERIAGLRSVCIWCYEPEKQCDTDTQRHHQLLPRARGTESFCKECLTSQIHAEGSAGDQVVAHHVQVCRRAGRA
jgi:hypothetical protein